MAQGRRLSFQKLPWTPPSMLGTPPHHVLPQSITAAQVWGPPGGHWDPVSEACSVMSGGWHSSSSPSGAGRGAEDSDPRSRGAGGMRALAPGSPFRDEDSCLA